MPKASIHVLDNTNEQILKQFTNTSKEQMVLENRHTRNEEEHSETFDFKVPYKYITTFENQNRVVIPDERPREFREFVIKEVEVADQEIYVICDGAWLDDLARNSEPFEPMNRQNITVDEAVEVALARTGYKKGDIEFDGYIDLVTTEYKTAYEILIMIEELTGLRFDSTIDIQGSNITGRYVNMRARNDFDGKELVRGFNVTGIKKKESTRELITALIVTSTDAKGKPIVTKVYDDNARDRWGNQGKFSWAIHNVDASEKDKMTVEKLKTIGEKELKKLVNSAIDYEVTAIEIHDQLKEQVFYGDRIRVRDVTYTPHFYLEASVKTISRDIFDDSAKEFTLGEIKTYREQDLRKYFTSIKSELQNKLNDSINNVDTIIGEISENVAYNSIHKANTAPTYDDGIIPINKLWLDTSTQPAILKRWNGTMWIIDSPTKPEDVGAVAKETAMIESLVAVYKNIAGQHLALNAEVAEIIKNEFLVDNTVKSQLTASLTVASNLLVDLGNLVTAKQALINPSMTDVIQVQEKLNIYNDAVKEVRISISKARKAIDDRLKLLQSQYSEEKKREIFREVAEVTGLEYDEKTGNLYGDIQATDATITKVYEKVNAEFAGKYVLGATYSSDKAGIVQDIATNKSAIEQTKKEINLEVSNSKINTQLKTLQQAVSAIKVLADGITINSSADGLISNVIVDPNKVAIKSNLISLGDGDVEITRGVTRIKKAVINDGHIDNISFNVMSGGVLNLGGYEQQVVLDSSGNPIKEQVLDDDGNLIWQDKTVPKSVASGEINFRDENNEIQFQISNENKGADKFTVGHLIVADKIENDYLPTKDSEPTTIYVLGNEADEDLINYDANAGVLRVNTVQDALNLVPDIVTYDVTIIVQKSYGGAGDPAEDIILRSKLGAGQILIDFSAVTVTTTTRITVEGCQCRVHIKRGKFDFLDGDKNYIVQNYYSHWVGLEYCDINGDNSSGLYGVSAYGGGNTFLNNCDIQNVQDCVVGNYLNNVYMVSNTGKGARYGAIAWRGSTININGTAPLGGSGTHATKSYGGNINTDSATYPAPPVTKTPTKTATTKTVTFKPSSANHYRLSGYNSWARSGDFHYGYPVQGSGYGAPAQVGAWFGWQTAGGQTMASVLKGKTIKSIKLKISRRTGIGNSTKAKINIRMHQHQSQPSGLPTYTSNYKEIAMDWNQTMTIDLTSTFKGYINTGNWYGFGIKPVSQSVAYYAELNKTAEVTVTYV